MNKDYSTIKRIMLAIGIVLIIFGIILLVYGFSSFGNLWSDFSDPFDNNVRSNGFSSIGFISAGGFLLIIGIALVYISQFRRATKYFATEASPAITTASHALGKGLGDGLKESEVLKQTPKEIIKIKCPHCGFLESIDAEFCSKCGKKV